MQEEHELEMKAEELFNMTFGPLTWNPDDEDEAKANPSENDFMMMDEDLGGDLRVKAMEACMSVIAAIADQHEEDSNQIWN